MRLLLDTNALLWMLAGSPRIEPVRELLLAEETEVFVSAVSWWEIAVKTHIGKLDADVAILRNRAYESGLRELPLSGVHAEALTSIKPLHNDPFDHMLIAQALSEPMRFLTGDTLLEGYSSLVILI